MAKVGTVAGLARLLVSEEAALAALRKRREELAAGLDALAQQVGELAGTAVAAPAAPAKKGGRKKGEETVRKVARKRGKKTLQQAVTEILNSSPKPMRASEIAAQLTKVDYTTKSKDPANMVSAVLGKKGAFVRAAKGLYTTKGK